MSKNRNRIAKAKDSKVSQTSGVGNTDALANPSHAQKENPHLVIASTRQMFSGPLPHPQDLSAYEAITPGMAERIVKMAEAEQSHRHRFETTVIQLDIDREGNEKKLVSRGQVFGFFQGMGCLGIAGYAVFQGQPWVAGIAIGAIAGILGIFVLRERYRRTESSDNIDKPNENNANEPRPDEEK